jgi:ABC-type Zn2+ transport system substrate-binding protein/surface adhesin
MVGYLEPKPGIPPTTTHLRHLVEQMRAEQVKLILSAPYYSPAHARFVSQQTGAQIARVTHEAGGVEGTEEYLGMVDHNVRQLLRQPTTDQGWAPRRHLARVDPSRAGRLSVSRAGP